MASWPSANPSSSFAVGSGGPASWADQIGQAIQVLGQGPQSYTPSLANMTIGNGTVAAYANKMGVTGSGGTCDFAIAISAGSTTTYTASGVTVTLPYTSTSLIPQYVAGRINSSASGIFVALLGINPNSTTGRILVPSSSSTAAIVAMSSSSLNPGTTGDLIFTGRYFTA